MTRQVATLLAAVTALLLLAVGGLSAYLYGEARRAVSELVARRMEAVGSTAARLVVTEEPGPALDQALADIARASELDAVYLVDADFLVLADARGGRGRRANLLRLDPDRARRAFAGAASVGWAFDVEGLRFLGGYFPVPGRGAQQPARAVIIEAGAAFVAPSTRLRAAAIAVFTLEAVISALALFALVLAVRAVRREREAYASAERAGLASRMAAAVAHEVRNPLGIIRGGAELLRERTQAARDRELLDDILGEVGRLNRLTQEFLDLAREAPLRPERVDLATLARDAADKVRLAYHAVTVDAPVSAPVELEADPDRVRQAVLNLLLNAAQATAGAGHLTVRVEERPGGGGAITVADDGPGVAEEVLPHLFEPFRSGKPSGTGLGLAVARRIAEQHGGDLRLLPAAAGKTGAAFEFSVPAAPIARARGA